MKIEELNPALLYIWIPENPSECYLRKKLITDKDYFWQVFRNSDKIKIEFNVKEPLIFLLLKIIKISNQKNKNFFALKIIAQSYIGWIYLFKEEIENLNLNKLVQLA